MHSPNLSITHLALSQSINQLDASAATANATCTTQIVLIAARVPPPIASLADLNTQNTGEHWLLAMRITSDVHH